MSSRRLAVTAVTGDALATEDIRNVFVPSVVNLFASSVTNGDEIGLQMDSTIIVANGELNTIAGDVVDVGIDQITFNTVVGRGTLRLPVPTLTTELQFLLSVEPIR